MEFKYRWRGATLSFAIGQGQMTVTSGGPDPVRLSIRGQATTVGPQEAVAFET